MEAYTPSPSGSSIEEVEEAVQRLLTDRGPTRNLFLFPGQSSSSDVAMMIRDLTSKETQIFRQGSPLSQVEQDKLVVLQFEEDLWGAFGMIGPFVPDELLKECQRRLYEADRMGTAHTTEVQSLMKKLALLDHIHRCRKASSALHFGMHHTGTWSSLKAEDPILFRQGKKKDFGRRFWAFIIGNDRYPSSPLSGCVNDGTLVQSYLIEYLGVPPAQISFLRNATREEMIDGFYDLRDNEKINRNDNILIHFSGHGTSYDTAEYFTTFTAKAGSIEGICPVNRGPSVPDISDRELNSILYELQVEKGNNITLFLDCCRSGGALRSHPSPEDGAIRYIVPLRTDEHMADLSAMFRAADENQRRRGDTPLTSCESWLGDIEGFVQLAGCQDFQLVREGIFPTGFITSAGPVDEATTFPRPAIVLPETVPRGPINPSVTSGKPPPYWHKSEFYQPKSSPYGTVAAAPKPAPAPPEPPASTPPAPTPPAPTPPMPQRYGYFTWALITVLKSEVGRTGTYEDVVKAIGRLSEMQDPIAVGRRRGSKLWYIDEN